MDENSLQVLQNKTLLIVDDEADLREPLVLEFESLGCKVFQAKNGRDAYEIVLKEEIDAVISDIRMPGGDGVEFLNRVKANHHSCPVVMLITGFSDLTPAEAYHLGAEFVLAKPFDLDTIDAAVVRILTDRESRWQTPVNEEKIKRNFVRNFRALEHAIASGEIALGRGGFFLKNESVPARGELVRFQIKFEEGAVLNLSGNGSLRWSRMNPEDHLPKGCGIEIEYLEAKDRAKLFEWIEEAKLVPYIPKGPKS